VLRTLVGELPDRIGQRVLLQGWVHRRRRLGAVAFLLVRDRSGVAQVVLGDGAVLDALPEETVIAVEGTVTAREQANEHSVDNLLLLAATETATEAGMGPLIAGLKEVL